jgi:hypothetical protein
MTEPTPSLPDYAAESRARVFALNAAGLLMTTATIGMVIGPIIWGLTR